jgi:hypothetical protein
MGCSVSYWADRDDELANAYAKVDLIGDHEFGPSSRKSAGEEDVVISCSEKRMTKLQTIAEIIRHRKKMEAEAEIRKYDEEFELYKKLRAKFG